MLRLTGVVFSVQFIGDGTSTSLVVDLTSDAASLYPENESIFGSNGQPQFTAGFSPKDATAVANIGSNLPSNPTATISRGVVTFTFATPPANGTTFSLQGTLVF